MTRGTEQGKKIDEIRLDWDTKLVVRYHASRYSPSFTVEVGDKSFTGKNLTALIEEATVYAKGWSELKWSPVILVETEIYSEIRISYSRAFRSRHKGKEVFRQWRVGEVNEGSFGSGWVKEDAAKTADRLDGGEPGEVMSHRGSGRILPYTHDRWTQLRELSRKVHEAMERTAEKLSEMLKQDDVDKFLESASGLKTLGLEWTGKAPSK
jgi:hypothetical protein